MQSPAWAQIKADFGWKSDQLEFEGRQIIAYKRNIPGAGRLVYIPGLSDVSLDSKFSNFLKATYKGKAFAVRLELNQAFNEETLKSLLKDGWKLAKKHVQYRHTVTVDLTKPEDDIWMGFKSRGRYEVQQAQKLGVRIEEADPNDANLEKMYGLMKLTSDRNKFFIRDSKFTTAYWEKFRELGQLKLFFAWHEDDLLSGAVILTNGSLAWYKDGGSTRTKSNLMAARLLQWEAMKVLKQAGITTYDLGGVPSPTVQLESSMHGIYVFKTAYSKETTELMPTLELPLSKRYALWTRVESHWLRVYNLLAHNLWW